jgi:hypothetical protein
VNCYTTVIHVGSVVTLTTVWCMSRLRCLGMAPTLNVCFGSEADIDAAMELVRFVPATDIRIRSPGSTANYWLSSALSASASWAFNLEGEKYSMRVL